MTPARRPPLAAALAAALALAAPALAQDFASPWAPLEPAAANLLEHGLPSAEPRAALELIAGRWLGIAGLETRALALGGGWRSARVAIGLSQTGDPELGWSAAAIGAGFGRETAGAALRFAGRRDRAAELGGWRSGGSEAGAGCWLRAAPALRLWASAPQLWVDGAAPPLARGFVIGAEATGTEFTAWVSRETVRLGGGDALHASHAAGLAWMAGGLRFALEARDQPLRGALTLAAGAGWVGVAIRMESHPVAGETTHLAIRLRAAGAP